MGSFYPKVFSLYYTVGSPLFSGRATTRIKRKNICHPSPNKADPFVEGTSNGDRYRMKDAFYLSSVTRLPHRYPASGMPAMFVFPLGTSSFQGMLCP